MRDKIVSEFEAHGFTIIGQVKSGYKTKQECVCKNGHINRKSMFDIRHRGGCWECHLASIGRSSEEVRSILDEIGYEWLNEQPDIRYSGRSRIVYRCPNGHTASVLLKTLLGGYRCKKCYRIRQRDSIKVIRGKVEARGWKLCSDEYVDRYHKMLFECSNGHKVELTYNHFVKGYECKECYVDSQRTDFEVIRSGLEDSGYKLLSNKEEYGNNKTKLECECPRGHKWSISWHSFNINGTRCPRCIPASGVSKAETELADYIESLGVEVVRNSRQIIAPYEVDIYIPSKKLAVEHDGLYWHSELSGGKDRHYHRNKYDLCLDIGIRLITLFEDELLKYREVVLSRIKSALGLVENRIYARTCSVDFVSSSAGRNFLSQYHLQGPGKARYYIGLRHKGNLVSVMSFGLPSRPHLRKSGLVELKRMCSKPGVQVVGGFSKMFKFVLPILKSDGFSKIVSYCDLRWSGITPVYEKMGFVLQNETKYTPHYIDTDYLSRLRNQALAIKPEERCGKSEWDIRREQGYDRIWDCGHRSYIYIIR